MLEEIDMLLDAQEGMRNVLVFERVRVIRGVSFDYFLELDENI